MKKKLKAKIQKKIKSNFIAVNSAILIIFLFALTSCTTKPQSLKIIETIKEDVKQTTMKIDTIEKEYNQLVIEKPECKNEIIIDNIKQIKSDIAGLSNKIAITEYVIKTETNAYKYEIKAIKVINFLLKLFLIASIIGFAFLLIKLRK